MLVLEPIETIITLFDQTKILKYVYVHIMYINTDKNYLVESDIFNQL